ncbi:unnamed protein product, partial [Porites evermanni]
KIVEGGIIQHASESVKQKFLFCFAPKSSWAEKKDDIPDTSKLPVSHRSSIDVERFELDLLREFQSEWFEVAIWPSTTGDDFPEFFTPDEVIESFPVGSPNRKRSRTRSARRSPGRQHSESDCGCGPAYKFVTLDADPYHKSQRPETCIVRYHGNFCTYHAFEIELHWIRATGSIVNNMVLTLRIVSSHLNCTTLLTLGNISYHNVTQVLTFSQSDLAFKLYHYLLAISDTFNLITCPLAQNSLFGFIRDSPYGSMHVSSPMVQMTPVQCRAHDYVHTRGVAFVRISTWEDDDDPFMNDQHGSIMGQHSGRYWGFYWMPNHMLTRRWRSAATGDKGSESKLRSEVEDFCADKNGVLTKFWELCTATARKLLQKGVEEEDKISLKEKDEGGCEMNRVEESDSTNLGSSTDSSDKLLASQSEKEK